jgi:hypothetical protein
MTTASKHRRPARRDRNDLEIVDRAECLQLLGAERVGRIGLSWGALPVVLPINYAFDHGEIILRTAPGTKLSAALAETVVAFEIDGYDSVGHTGWSVLVRGTARHLDEPAQIEAARRLPLRPWASDAADEFVVIACELVTGRRIHGWYPNPSSVGHVRRGPATRR